MTKINWRKYWWQPGFAVAFLATGVPYWLIPYNKLSLPDAVIGAGLIVVVAAAAAARVYSGKPFMRVVTVMGLTVPAAVVARVVFDGVRNLTTHNLWPIEMLIAILIGSAAALVGALLGSLALWMSRVESEDDQTG